MDRPSSPRPTWPVRFAFRHPFTVLAGWALALALTLPGIARLELRNEVAWLDLPVGLLVSRDGSAATVIVEVPNDDARGGDDRYELWRRVDERARRYADRGHRIAVVGAPRGLPPAPAIQNVSLICSASRAAILRSTAADRSIEKAA
jgi:hypothetical protein